MVQTKNQRNQRNQKNQRLYFVFRRSHQAYPGKEK